MKLKRLMIPLLSGLITLAALLAAFRMADLLPFGDRSLAIYDANIQYLDFYAFYQDVLAGKNSIGYSFSKTLGGNNMAVFSYYLSSPFCLLLPLFRRSEMNLYFNLTVLMKTVLAAVTMAVFLEFRSDKKKFSFAQTCYLIILSVGYAMSQYSIAQACNIMWLDSVYMLPLIMLGVSKFVHKREYLLLTVSVGLAIVFNWYSAGISCAFAFIWFIYEYFDSDNTKKGILHFIGSFFLFSFFMLVGVALSAAVFLPTIKALRNGSRGALEISSLFDLSFISNPLNIITNYVYGAESIKGRAALYCGILPLICSSALLISPKVPLRKKVLYGLMLIFLVLMFSFKPLITVFSLFKPVDTYWYRYSFIGIFILIALAGEYLCKFDKDYRSPVIAGLIFAAVILVYSFFFGSGLNTEIILTAGAVLLTGAVLILLGKSSGGERLRKLAISFVLIAMTSCDSLFNYQLLAKAYSTDDLSFSTYQKDANLAINVIRGKDSGYYRISQTAGRIMYDNGKTDSYNEAMAFNYWSISGYTSSPDDNQRALLHRLGYRMNGLNFNVTNACVLPSDSLLGVKYVMSPYEIQGLNKVSDHPYNGKYIFENPYALPMAFVYREGNNELDEVHTFEFQNDMYSRLCNEEVEVYKKLEYSLNPVDDGKSVRIEMDIPGGNYSVYGNIIWKVDQDLTLNVNDVYSIAYAEWNAQSVFYIPDAQEHATVTMLSSSPLNTDNYVYEFYALDLDLLEEVTEKITEGSVHKIKMENGYAEYVTENTKAGEKLYVSIPFDRGWEITVNGKEAEYDLLSDVLYTIHLEEGDNKVVMKYHTPALMPGICGSLGGIALLILIKLFEWKRKRKHA